MLTIKTSYKHEAFIKGVNQGLQYQEAFKNNFLLMVINPYYSWVFDDSKISITNEFKWKRGFVISKILWKIKQTKMGVQF